MEHSLRQELKLWKQFKKALELSNANSPHFLMQWGDDVLMFGSVIEAIDFCEENAPEGKMLEDFETSFREEHHLSRRQSEVLIKYYVFKGIKAGITENGRLLLPIQSPKFIDDPEVEIQRRLQEEHIKLHSKHGL